MMDMKRRMMLMMAGGLMVLLALSACSPQATDPAPDISTRVALTLAAMETPVTPAPSATAGPTDTSVPTDTPPPTDTPSPTDTPTPTATETPVSTETPTPPPGTPVTAQPLGTRVFFEDFSSGEGWYVNVDDNSAFEYADGGYQITNNVITAQFWSIREVLPTDSIQEVDARRKSGPVTGYFGVVCRHQEDGQNYYALVIGSDGFYGIAEMEDGTFSFLIQGVDDKNIIVRTDGAFNRIRGECVDDRLSLYANGQFLAETRDDTFESGRLGLLNGTKLEAGLVALFDNYGVYEP